VIVVLDASVILKWLLEDPAREPDTEKAFALVGDVEMLAAFEFPTTDSPTVIRLATSLAIGAKHHLFDTLYHAAALEHEDALLVTADERYYGKAKGYGTIKALHDWEGGA
jgi:predicted nucleic acid-binding protein